MENVSRFRAIGSICRQRAVFDPLNPPRSRCCGVERLPPELYPEP